VLREFSLAGRMIERVDADGRPLHHPPPVRAAATVMLLRDSDEKHGDGGVEVFAFRRVPRMAFAPGMLVFPGGSVDAADADAALAWDAPVDPAAAPALAAAVRETFEECGVLLAVPIGGRGAGRAPDAAELASPAWEERRTDLAEGRSTLAAVLAATGLAAAGSVLRPWARWVTPVFEHRRFDTWFYLARLPAGQEARDLGGEGERAAWLEPGDAVERHRAGELPMLPPTLVCLEELAAGGSVDELLATPRQVRPVSPWVVAGDDGLVLRIDLDGRGGGEPEEAP
jgi:8-oxo-dGTP pyrophosphatase MutT (NUDIX family)